MKPIMKSTSSQAAENAVRTIEASDLVAGLEGVGYLFEQDLLDAAQRRRLTQVLEGLQRTTEVLLKLARGKDDN
jgi:hypothetical protein